MGSCRVTRRRKEWKDRTRSPIQISATMAELGVDILDKAPALQYVVERRPEVREWLLRKARNPVED